MRMELESLIVLALSNRNEGLCTVSPPRSDHRRAVSVGTIAQQLDVETEALELADQNVEGFRKAGLDRGLALDERLVDLGPAVNVVGLDGQQLLQDVGRPVSLERPDLHLAEALAAELRLTAQRLLGDEGVRTDRPRVDLVVHEVRQLEDVDEADRDELLERLPGLAVPQGDLAGGREARHPELSLDVGLERSVEHRRSESDSVRERLRVVEDDVLGRLREGLADRPRGDDLEELGADRRHRGRPLGGELLAEPLAVHRGRPPEVGLEDLTDVHPRRHAERVEHDLDGRAVRHVRHVLLGEDAGDDALVAVAAGHLVADRELALHRDEDLDHLDDAGGELVPLLEGRDLLVVELLEDLDALLRPLLDAAHLGELLLVRRRDLAAVEVFGGDLRHDRARQDRALVEDELLGLLGLERSREGLALEELDEPLPVLLAEDADLVLEVLVHPLDVGVLDLERAGVLLDALAAEDLDVDDRAFDPGRRRERRVAHVAGLLAEDRAEELFLRGELGLALGRDLPYEDVARLDVGADPDDPRLVEVLQELLGDVRDVARDLLGPELGVARLDLELLDVDRGERVLTDELLGDEDRVLEVVAAPRHERDEHVPSERELAQLRARTVGEDLPLVDLLAHADDRLLVDARILVRPLELRHRVDVGAHFARHRLRLPLHADDDALAVDVVDRARPARHDAGARVARGDVLHAGADVRRAGAEQRHRLALHVRSHQRAVRVVVLEERDQRGGHRDELLRRHVAEVDLVPLGPDEVARLAAVDAIHRELAVVVDLRVRLRDDVLILFPRREVIGVGLVLEAAAAPAARARIARLVLVGADVRRLHDVADLVLRVAAGVGDDDEVGHAAVLHLAVRRLDEPELVDARVARQRRDQADVRTFRRLDRADAPVVRR